MFDLSDKFTRMLTCTLLAGGGALVATLVPGGFAAGLAVFAGGISGGILSGDIHSDLLTRIRNQSDLLKNGDLAKVAAHAAASVIRSLVEDQQANLTSGQREQLKILANELEARWESYIARPDWNVQLEGVTESELPDFFRDVEQNVHQRRALTPEIWKELIRDVATQSKRGIDDNSLTLAATWLHERFAQALWGVAKAESAGNGPTGGKGFAALQLMMFGEILGSLDALKQYAEHSQEKLDQLPKLLVALKRCIVNLHKSHQAQIQVLFATLPERILEHLRGYLKEDLSVKPNNLPYLSMGTLFKGRQGFLKLMEDKLSSGSTHAVGVLAAQAIHGLGGVGKTRAAIEYAWEHQEEFSALLFVTADSPESLQRNLADLIGPQVLDIKAAQQVPDQSARVAAALRWLQEYKGWFLILDNVDTKQAALEVEKLVTQLTGGQIVITSRLTKWSKSVEPLPLHVLTPEDGRDFLLERTAGLRHEQADDEARALKIAEDVDGLALALEQVGAYIAELGISFEQYQQRWESKRQQVLEWHDEQVMQYPTSLAMTWQTSFDQLTPAGKLLLEHLSWFAPDPIPEFVFDEEEPAKLWEEILEEDVRIALADLRRYSLVQKEPAADWRGFSVHRLVQEITRRNAGHEVQTRRIISTLKVANACCFDDPPPEDVRSWPRWDPLAPHIATALASVTDCEFKEEFAIRLMSCFGVFLHASVRYRESEEWHRRAVRDAEILYGESDFRIPPLINNLALLLHDTNRFGEAESLMRRAVAICDMIEDTDDDGFGTCLNNLARQLISTNKLAEAEPLLRRALATDEATWGPEHPNVARDLGNLACLLTETNRSEEAEPLMRRALTIDESAFGNEHPYVARDLSNLAYLLHSVKRFGEAEPLLRRALTISEHSRRRDHPDLARDLNNLARMLQDMKRLAEAEPLMRRMVEIYSEIRSRTGYRHPNLTKAIKNYWNLLEQMRVPEDEQFQRILNAGVDPAWFNRD
ncbi:MAG: tetratricopeptide repeat protein [Planctomycetaceae bacterium]